MERELNQNQWSVQELIEQKEFDALNDQERNRVLSEMDEATYRLSRKLVLEAAELVEEEEDLVPAPLVLPATAATGNSLGVYRALLAVAAAVIVFLLVFPLGEQEVLQPEVKYLTQTDTIYQTQYVYDTVYEVETVEVERVKTVEKRVEVPVLVTNLPRESASERVYDAQPVISLENLLQTNPVSSSGSAQNDPTISLIPEIGIGLRD